MHCYARLLAHYPYVVIATVTVIASSCLIISFTLRHLPNFEDPQLGFEPRGTILAQRATAWENLQEATKRASGPLTINPSEYTRSLLFHQPLGPTTTTQSSPPTGKSATPSTPSSPTRTTRRKLQEAKINLKIDIEAVEQYGIVTEVDEDNKTWAKPGQDEISKERKEWHSLKSLNEDGYIPPKDEGFIPEHVNVAGFFCGEPSSSYSRVMFQATSGEDLFSVPALRSMCAIENGRMRDVDSFEALCVTTTEDTCCRTWSVSNYVMLLRNRSACNEIREDDTVWVMDMLKACSKFYYNLQLRSDCYEKENCHGIPARCTYHNAVYVILHYLADIHFLNPQHESNNTRLTYAMSFLPIACSSKALPYFRSIEAVPLLDGTTEVVAMDMGLRYTLFNEYLVHDTMFLGLAVGLIILLMWMYTGSLFITLMAITAIIFSLGIAYFIYTLVFDMEFFPFMNLLTGIIIVGIGADDAFIYCKVWACAKSEKNNGTLVKLVSDTLKHATLSMFVTSLTTAAAFYASYISSITAIRCFSLFAGTTVLANFFLMVTWLPATIVIAEKWCSLNCCLCIPPFGLYAPQLQRYPYCSKVCNALWKLHYHFTDWARIFFEKILPCIVIKPRYLWVTTLGGVTMCGVVSVFYYPKLQLPDSSEFQILSADHPFEKYDLLFKDLFWFEKVQKVDILSKLPLRFVWGIRPVDNGNYMNPADKGTLVYDDNFNVAAPESQKWLLAFCKQLRNQTFYQSTVGPLLPNCFIESFVSWMERRCVDPVYGHNRSPCCEKSKFPYTEDVFNKCIRLAVKSLYETPAVYNIPGVAGPRFSKETGMIKAVVVEYDSNHSFTVSYSEMHTFFGEVESWVAKMLATAPNGMKNGWFVSYFEFYDLQQSLLYGTGVAIGVAMGISFIVLFVTTLNCLISVYAILTIASVIFVTVGTLVLLGWKMNVLESITATVAIGLAVDFTLHYGVVYKLSPEDDRESAVIFSLSRMGSPIAMAAFTTFVAGLSMMPSSVLGYIQIGTFVMIIMTVSWIYATFFFQSLLRLIGPEKKFGQFHYPSFDCCATPPPHVDKTVYNYALSESTLSTSSTGYPIAGNANESHELEPLTVNAKSERPRTTGHKYIKHKTHSRSPRQRSGSLSVTFSERDPSLSSLVPKSPRKVSLPTGAIDLSPRHVSVATSSTTIIFSDEDREPVMLPNKSLGVPDVWVKRTDEGL